MGQRKILRKEIVRQARRFVAKQEAGFREHSEIVEAFDLLVALRGWAVEPKRRARKVSSLEERATRRFHERLQAAEPSLPIVQVFERYQLDPLERELLLLLAASSLGFVPPPSDMEDFQKMLRRSIIEKFKVARALSEDGRLAKAGLITVHDPEDMHGLATIDPSIVSQIIDQGPEESEGWEVQSQEEIFERFLPLFTKLRERSAALDGAIHHFMHSQFGLHSTNRKIYRLTRALYATLQRHPDWPISESLCKLSWPETQMVVVLIGKELGFCHADDELFLGEGIARAASPDLSKVLENLAALKRERTLQKEGLVRICGGYGDAPVFDDEGTLRTCDFELADDFRTRIGIKKNLRRVRTRYRVHTPSVKFDDLVLPEAVTGRINLILAHAKYGHVLMNDWGMGKLLPYGRGLTVLFAGPPGVGKTASAEALAHELGKPLLTANYAEIENSYVGQTEKNIVRVFREATEAGAVLFLDEADAMLYSRDGANRTWENRQINVVLQELERFDGLCILATNRKLALDEALERRLTVKIEFERPRSELRRQIWGKLLAAGMPISPDVNINRLADADLTGGEIKNVVVNAARIALERNPDPKGSLTMEDFQKAVDMEVGGRWTAERVRPIGFTRGREDNPNSGAHGETVKEAARDGARNTKAKL